MCLGFDFYFCSTLAALFNIKITGLLDWLPGPQMAVRRTWCCIYVTAVPLKWIGKCFMRRAWLGLTRAGAEEGFRKLNDVFPGGQGGTGPKDT